MKTIVLFFVLVAFAGVSALPSRKHKAKESQNGFVETPNNDWPQPTSLGQFEVPEAFGGAQSEGGSSSGGPSGGSPSGDDPNGGGPSGVGPSGGGPSGEGPSGGGQGSGDNDNPSGKSRVKSSRRRN